ncbi:MAG: hypothetical protein CMN30_12880 [Sandaracinus sp.]|nr:hypothetical protein [Sandaracinus sp.]|tara:strand:+ start:1849 stop:2829 length:981 start_codon:yes stop_codon:yes gene_type:complete
MRSLLVLAVLVLGCGDAPTQTFVRTRVVGYEVPGEVDAVVYDVVGPDGLRARKTVFLETLDPEKRNDFRFAVVLADRHPLEGFTVEAHGEIDGVALTPPLAATVSLPFERHGTQTVEVVLARPCAAGCPAGFACEDQVCVPQGVDAGPGERDGGTRDGGILDGGTRDGGPPDLGVDAGIVTECPEGCECVDLCDGRSGDDCSCNGRSWRCPCGLACSPGARCEAQCKFTTEECVVAGPRAESLSVQCDTARDCRVDANGARSVDVDCKRLGSCAVDCRGARECEVRCRQGAHCLLRCSGPDCGFGMTDCDPVDCGGGVWVCNQSCP